MLLIYFLAVILIVGGTHFSHCHLSLVALVALWLTCLWMRSHSRSWWWKCRNSWLLQPGDYQRMTGDIKEYFESN